MDTVSRVAVVEDDPEISRMMPNYMTDHGFEVTAARNGRDLDRVLSGGKIDCVILDVGLPGEDGLSICRRLRGKSTGKTTYTFDLQVKEAHCGANSYTYFDWAKAKRN